LAATTTSGQHQVSKIIPPPHRVDTPKAKETTLSGNSVEMDTELMKVADTSMDYQLTTNIYRRQIAMLRAAIGRPGQ
jgi:flagellar basal-body rod protein FlgB